MAIDLKSIRVEPDSAFGTLLAGVRDRVFIIQCGDVRYLATRIDPPEDRGEIGDEQSREQATDPRRDQFQAALREVSEVWRDVDPEELKDYIYSGRDAGTSTH